jgi:hypothetical protein
MYALRKLPKLTILIFGIFSKVEKRDSENNSESLFLFMLLRTVIHQQFLPHQKP